MSRDVFNAVPLWAVFLLTCLVILVALEVGFRLAHWRGTQRHKAEKAPTGVVTGALLGLVSFLLAFTFGIAASHYDDRKSTVLEEANAIGTVYLRLDFLTEDRRTEAVALLKEYTEIRVEAAVSGVNRSEFYEIAGRSEKIQKRLWQLAVDNAKTNPSPATALLVSGLNDLIDVHGKRLTHSVHNKIPIAIWISLYAIACVGIASAAYRIAQASTQRSEMLPALIITFAAVMTLIADLDDPRHGFLVNDQAPMQAALASFEQID